MSQYPLFQYAYFVNDLETSINKWAKLYYAGPFSVTPHHVTDKFHYRGQDVEGSERGSRGPARGGARESR